MSTKLSPLPLSFWMAGAENTKLGQAAYKWFSLLGKAAAWAIDTRDPLTCGEAMLDLMAWERGVTRTPFDTERLYRLRVKHAFENGKDAGNAGGWKRIRAKTGREARPKSCRPRDPGRIHVRRVRCLDGLQHPCSRPGSFSLSVQAASAFCRLLQMHLASVLVRQARGGRLLPREFRHVPPHSHSAGMSCLPWPRTYGEPRMSFLKLDDYTVPGFGLNVGFSGPLKDEDASGESSSTARAKKETRAKSSRSAFLSVSASTPRSKWTAPAPWKSAHS